MIYVDARIARTDLQSGQVTPSVLMLPGLACVDMRPPASGPEVELTFGPYGDSAATAAEKLVVDQLERAGAHVLASRTRDDGWTPRSRCQTG